MQAHTPEVSAEKATTPADQRLVSVEQLKKIHRDLNACQKVIWLAGCGPRGYGFDQSYVTDAQERLKELDTLIAEPAPVQDGQQTVYVECRECSGCGHVGINDSLEKNAACSRCAWIGPSPAEDTCPGCAADNVMSAACPKCGCIYRLLTDAEIYAPVAQTAPHPEQSERWQSVTRPGQIDVGDWLSFTVGGCLICAKARDVLNPGTDREEVIYNRAKNYYFITRMAVDGSSSHKGVMRAAPCAHVGDT